MLTWPAPMFTDIPSCSRCMGNSMYSVSGDSLSLSDCLSLVAVKGQRASRTDLLYPSAPLPLLCPIPRLHPLNWENVDRVPCPKIEWWCGELNPSWHPHLHDELATARSRQPTNVKVWASAPRHLSLSTWWWHHIDDNLAPPFFGDLSLCR